MRIKGSELKKIINEEIRRSMRLNEADDVAPKMDFGTTYMRSLVVTSGETEEQLADALVRAMLSDRLTGNPIKNIAADDEIVMTGQVYSKVVELTDDILPRDPSDPTEYLLVAPIVDSMSINGVPVSTSDLTQAMLRSRVGFNTEYKLEGKFSADFSIDYITPPTDSESLRRALLKSISQTVTLDLYS